MPRSLLVFKTVNKVCPCVLISTRCLLSSSSGNIFYTQWLASSTKPPPIFFGLQGEKLSNTKITLIIKVTREFFLIKFPQLQSLWAAALESQEWIANQGDVLFVLIFEP